MSQQSRGQVCKAVDGAVDEVVDEVVDETLDEAMDVDVIFGKILHLATTSRAVNKSCLHGFFSVTNQRLTILGLVKPNL